MEFYIVLNLVYSEVRRPVASWNITKESFRRAFSSSPVAGDVETDTSY